MPKKTLQGTVVTVPAPQTAKVKVVRQWQHPVYLKRVQRSKSYTCHVEGLELAVGDAVIIEECRPMSKTKHFKVVEKVTVK
jgi:small subunit ribosomal protein S17